MQKKLVTEIYKLYNCKFLVAALNEFEWNLPKDLKEEYLGEKCFIIGSWPFVFISFIF